MNEKLKKQKHKVIMEDITTKILINFDSISQAKRKTGFSKTSIYKSLRTNNQISANRLFKFYENTNI